GIDSIIVDCRFTNEKFTSNIISIYLEGLKNTNSNNLKSLKDEILSFSQSYLNKGNFIDGRIHENN
ncbi:hypothetical protein LJB96_02305, partial [Methanobrevibacter sp. OttesenSCG-928-K11]|nr:hypothetical protein [Methanobrevibacter sp. OttesenSCG-928-K11]